MGGLIHRNGDINICKWYDAVNSWLQYDVCIILLSEMQPSNTTSDAPNSKYLIDYNPEKTRKPRRGTGCAIHKQLLEAFIRINISAPHQSGYWVLQLSFITLIIGAWYGPVNSNYRTINERRTYWTAWAKALWKARDLYPTAAIIAGGDANVILHSLHPEHTQDGAAKEFETLI